MMERLITMAAAVLVGYVAVNYFRARANMPRTYYAAASEWNPLNAAPLSQQERMLAEKNAGLGEVYYPTEQERMLAEQNRGLF